MLLLPRVEVHLFILWERARPSEARILDDIEASFRVLDVVDVTWSPEHFTRSLVRFYGDALPPDSDKERECGTGPFVAVVIADDRPRHRWRRRGRRPQRVNARVVDAKARYRSWAGGDYRVHASDHAREAERDLVLLFGRRSATWRDARTATRRRHDRDLIGTDGWADVDALLLALDVTSRRRVLDPAPGVDLALAVDDLWWAEHVIGGEDLGGGRRRVTIAGATRVVALEERGRRSHG